MRTRMIDGELWVPLRDLSEALRSPEGAEALESPVSDDLDPARPKGPDGGRSSTTGGKAPATRGLRELVEAYSADMVARGTWSRRWARNKDTYLREIVSHWGEDFSVRGLTRDRVRGWRDMLANGGRSGQTTNNYLVTLAGLLDWCIEEGCMAPPNPARGLKIRKIQETRRLPFSDEDLHRIFRNWVERKETLERYWVPLLCIYTGARPDEVVRLRCIDLQRRNGGILAVHLRGTKTSAADRWVPIHSHLEQLGLLDALLRREGGPLFTGIDLTREQPAQGVGAWFNLRLRQLGIEAPKVLYSCRHTVATKLKEARVPEHEIAQILGHRNDNITTGRYGHDVSLVRLQEAIETLDIPGLSGRSPNRGPV